MDGPDDEDSDDFVALLVFVTEEVDILPDWLVDPPDAPGREPRRPILPSNAGAEALEPPR